MQITLASWNINGIRAAIKKDFWRVAQTLEIDVFSLQEIKAGQDVMTTLKSLLDYAPYSLHSHSSIVRSGYSGVATFSLARDDSSREDENLFAIDQGILVAAENNRTAIPHKLSLTSFEVGLGIEKFDEEGRTIITRYRTPSQDEFTLINAYYPQGGRGQFRIDYKIEFYAAILAKAQQLRDLGQKVILCGDFNTTVTDIDLARPKENRNTTGCLPEERKALNDFFEAGFVDSFRHFNPDITNKYTYWDQITRARQRNVGWRIDYFLVDQALLPQLKAASIHDEILGSDHCPVSIKLEF